MDGKEVIEKTRKFAKGTLPKLVMGFLGLLAWSGVLDNQASQSSENSNNASLSSLETSARRQARDSNHSRILTQNSDISGVFEQSPAILDTADGSGTVTQPAAELHYRMVLNGDLNLTKAIMGADFDRHHRTTREFHENSLDFVSRAATEFWSGTRSAWTSSITGYSGFIRDGKAILPIGRAKPQAPGQPFQIAGQ